MKNNRLAGWMRGVLLLCGIAIFAVLFIPFWRIDLAAPQYPEGLTLLIYTNKLAGDVDIINGLNHYIGMKTLHANDFVEFTVLPYLTAAFAILFMLCGIVGKRGLLRVAFIAFVLFGIVAMADFWKWEYNYGHDLNPDAAIKVPGMAYQPPLIGYKQLLNFGAYSIPAIGGWLFIGAGVIAAFIMVYDIKLQRRIKAIKNKGVKNYVPVLMVAMIIAATTSCNVKPEPLQPGKDNCYFCKMTVSDTRFGAEVISKKGKIYKFDDMHCLVSFLHSNELDQKQVKEIYVVDFSGTHELIQAQTAYMFSGEALHSPMNGNVAAFSNADSMRKIMETIKGTPVTWKELNVD